MKKYIALLSALFLIALSFCGCGDKENADSTSKKMNRLNYNYDMSEYVELDTYKLDIDKSSELYQDAFNARLREVMVGTLKEGQVEKGDTANIDYVGKKDGVAFDGGTAKGYDLEIGSNQFIAGFEDGLIGAEIGKTIDLNLSFPSDYGEASLAGQAVVFTVTVNYVTRSFDTVNNDTAVKCGFDSAQQVMDMADEYALESTVWETLYKNAKIATYPTKENNLFYNEQYKAYERMAEYNGITVEELVDYYGMTLDQLKDEINNTYLPEMAHTYALSYYILDAEGEKLTDEYIEQVKKELDENAGQDILEMGISKSYLEAEAARYKAIEIAVKYATIK